MTQVEQFHKTLGILLQPLPTLVGWLEWFNCGCTNQSIVFKTKPIGHSANLHQPLSLMLLAGRQLSQVPGKGAYAHSGLRLLFNH